MCDLLELISIELLYAAHDCDEGVSAFVRVLAEDLASLARHLVSPRPA